MLSVAQTAASPDALPCQAYCLALGSGLKRPVTTSKNRSGLADGSSSAIFPKKLSSVDVERAVWESVDPTIPNLKGFDAKLLFVFEAALQRFARVFTRQHVGRVRAGSEAAFVPGLEVSKLVVHRQSRMGLAVTLRLCDFVDRLPAHALCGIVAVDRLLRRERHIVEHQPE